MLQKHLADNTNEHSIAVRLRRERFKILINMLNTLPHPISILDIGGTAGYWEMMGAKRFWGNEIQITLLNVEVQSVSLPGFRAITGDGRSMPQFVNGQFDVVFSNSTIEHVGSVADQRQMAEEVRRVGRRYYVQTPNRYFPIEPHFVFPFFQFLPIALRVWLLQHFNLGWHPKTPDRQRALSEVTSIRLLTKAELHHLFPNATLFEEKFLGLVKSFVAYTP